MNSKPKEQLVKEVRGIIQIALTAAIFFTAFLNSFSPTNLDTLLWGLSVAIYMLDYLSVELIGTELGERWASWLKASLYGGIFTFIPPTIIISVFAKQTVSHTTGLILMYSLIATLALPAASLILTFVMMAQYDWQGVREVYRLIRDKKPRSDKEAAAPKL